MRILHTADWHLGHLLRDTSRVWEHGRFLDWLLDAIEEHGVDAVLIAGDVFDAANPPAEAVSAWFTFLARARRRFPALGLVAIGGNHDSAARLDAPTPLLAPLELHVIGGARMRGQSRAMSDFAVPLRGAGGDIAAVVVAVPFLRPVDVAAPDPSDPAASALGTSPDGGPDPLVEGVREFYERAFESARAAAPAGVPLVGMGHLYLARTQLSELSERKILGGNQHALPADVFPADAAYVALGHLHLAQSVGAEHVRYSGSPLPLSMPERTYRHQVIVVDVEGGRSATPVPLAVPRWVPFLRMPERGHLGAADLIAALESLDVPDPLPGAPRAFVEVGLRLDAPEPELRRRLADALRGKHAVLARIDAVSSAAPACALAGEAKRLRELSVEHVFRAAWERRFSDAPPPAMLQALHEVVDDIYGEGGGVLREESGRGG